MSVSFLKKWLFLSACLFSVLSAAFEFGSKHSQLNIGIDSQLIQNTIITNIQGLVRLDSGAEIAGSSLVFNDGLLGNGIEDKVQVTGDFTVDTATIPMVESFLGNNQITFTGNNSVQLKQDVALTSTWEFLSDTIIDGRYELDLTDENANFIIGSNTTVRIINSTIKGFDLDAVTFTDNTSTLIFLSATVSLGDDITMETGNLVVGGESEFLMNTYDVLFAETATFTVNDGASLWLDNRGAENDPVFSYIITNTNSPTGTSLVSALDNTLIRISTDQSVVIDPGVSALTSGLIQPLNNAAVQDPGAGTPVQIKSSTTINPGEQIVVNDNIEISGSGSSLTFAGGGDEAQVVVPPGKTVTFGDIELLRINQSTFKLDPDSTIRFKENTIMEFVDDVYYDRGFFVVTGSGNQVLMRGLGGTKKITLKPSPEGFNPTFAMGNNNIVLEDVEIQGLQYFSSDTSGTEGNNLLGAMILTGNTRINIDKDSRMSFLVRGQQSRLIMQNNDLTLGGKIRFADTYDSTLHIGFSLSSDTEELSLNFGQNTMVLGCEGGLTGLVFEDDIVTLKNLSASSFSVTKRSFLGGEVLSITNNPIVQQTENFVLRPGLDLRSPLFNPIDFVSVEDDGRSYWRDFGCDFVRESFRVSLPRPRIVVKNALAGLSLKNVVAVRPGATIRGLSPSRADILELLMLGDARAITTVRRSSRVAGIARVVTDPSDVSDDTFDIFKETDKIYVSGINNVIEITGSLEIQGQIIMDDESELIFKFDEAVDSPKAVSFSNLAGQSLIELPKSASIVFEGNGLVFFGQSTNINFQGTSLEDSLDLGSGFFKDDRPSLIFKRFAQLVIDQVDTTITFKGNGKLQFYDGAQLTLDKGKVVIGEAEDNFFDLVFDKNSLMLVGAPGDTASTDVNFMPRISMARGLFNMRFDRKSRLEIRSNSVLEIGVENSIFTAGQLNSVVFTRDSGLSILGGGFLSLGQESLDELVNDGARFNWDNSDGSVSGSGAVNLVLGQSSQAFLSAVIQTHTFAADFVSPYEVFKGLAKVTGSLNRASDFIDPGTGLTKLITPNNVIVTLSAGDTLTIESPNTGNVYGTSAGGQRFVILPNGTKQFLV